MATTKKDKDEEAPQAAVTELMDEAGTQNDDDKDVEAEDESPELTSTSEDNDEAVVERQEDEDEDEDEDVDVDEVDVPPADETGAPGGEIQKDTRSIIPIASSAKPSDDCSIVKEEQLLVAVMSASDHKVGKAKSSAAVTMSDEAMANYLQAQEFRALQLSEKNLEDGSSKLAARAPPPVADEQQQNQKEPPADPEQRGHLPAATAIPPSPRPTDAETVANTDSATADDNSVPIPQFVRQPPIRASESQPGAFPVSSSGALQRNSDAGSGDDDQDVERGRAAVPTALPTTPNVSGGTTSTATMDQSSRSEDPVAFLVDTATLAPPANSSHGQHRPEQDADDDQVVVQATKAPEGFHALISNKRFKYLAALFVVVLLAIVIPVAVLAPSSTTTTGTDTTKCGTLRLGQADYSGTISVTESGKICQRWDSQYPHSHSYDPSVPSASSSILEENYCRNPEGVLDPRVWCYTTDPKVEWEWCDVPNCDGEVLTLNDQCGSLTFRQRDYRGDINITATGKSCQAWDSQFPHNHTETPESFPSAGLGNGTNYCRTPDSTKRAWCYTTDPDVMWDYCDIPVCSNFLDTTPETCANCTVQECGTKESLQNDYRGALNTTVSGRTCASWTPSNFLRIAAYAFQDPVHFVIDNDLNNSYCRNPQTKRTIDMQQKAWCFTTDPDKEWEFCDVPFCSRNDNDHIKRDCGSRSKQQTDYRGAVKKTETGNDCTRWDDVEGSNEFLALYPLAGLVGWYCRNPGGQHERAWCYTTGNPYANWEYCNVTFCEDMEVDHESTSGTLEESISNSSLPDDIGDATSNYNNTYCGTSLLRQQDYRGSISVTDNNRTCQRWDVQEPHPHKYTPNDTQSAGLEENYCRNPTGSDPRAWCYTTDPLVPWEYCDVPFCENPIDCGTMGLRQRDYRGSINTTIHGYPCQSWGSQDPHPHRFNDTVIALEEGLESNYCRNPDQSEMAWCYTTDPVVIWDYCNISAC